MYILKRSSTLDSKLRIFFFFFFLKKISTVHGNKFRFILLLVVE